MSLPDAWYDAIRANEDSKSGRIERTVEELKRGEEIRNRRNGKPNPKCRKCHGTGKIKCYHCHGAGEVDCNYCHGKGLVPNIGTMTMQYCLRKMKCTICNGQKELPCSCREK